ncbi:MAG: dihydrodipicolinate reductase [Terriglobia bacterium]
MSNKIRVIQYGVGPIGAGVVRLMLQKPNLEIVGAIDTDPEKVGKDLGSLAGADRHTGVMVSDDAKSVLHSGADVVLHTTSSYLKHVTDQLMACMEAGLHVISTCEELSYPFRKYPELSARLDQCARENKVAVFGTGVNPGFAMDKLVLTLATVCHRVDKVQVYRIVDASKRRQPLQKKVGSGLTVEEFQLKRDAGIIKHHGLPESAAMIADSLGLQVDRIEETIDPVIAKETVKTDFFEVPPGRVVGVRQIASGLKNDEENVRLELQMYLGAPDPIDAIKITGVPGLNLQIPGGIHGDLATAAVAVNCIPAILEAKPGLRTSKDIPMCYLPGVVQQG